MKPSEALASNPAAIRQVVESHHARNARVFGSVLRGQDTDSSDHGYFKVDYEIVWRTIHRDLPGLYQRVSKLTANKTGD